jgi:hypothetical protein
MATLQQDSTVIEPQAGEWSAVTDVRFRPKAVIREDLK